MALLIGVNLACWAPVAVIWLMAAFTKEFPVPLQHAKYIAVFVFPLNSCANPFLYAILTSNFQRDLVALIKAVPQTVMRRRSSVVRMTPISSASKSSGPPPLPVVAQLKQASKDKAENGDIKEAPQWRRILRGNDSSSSDGNSFTAERRNTVVSFNVPVENANEEEELDSLALHQVPACLSERRLRHHQKARVPASVVAAVALSSITSAFSNHAHADNSCESDTGSVVEKHELEDCKEKKTHEQPRGKNLCAWYESSL